MTEPETAWDVFFESEGGNPLSLTEEEQKEFKIAILDLNYEELFKPLFRRHEDFVKVTKMNYLIVIVLLSISIALNLIREFGW